MAKPNRKVITFSERQIEMIDEIMEARGYLTVSGTVHSAIAEMHSKMFPLYAERKRLSPEDRMRSKASAKDLKEKMAEEEVMKVVEELDGQISIEHGNKIVVFYNYVGKKRYEQRVPISMITPDLVKIQYQPSKDKVLRLRKEGKTDY